MSYLCVCVCVCVCACVHVTVSPLTQKVARHSMVKEEDHRGEVGVEVHAAGGLLKLEDTQSTVTIETNELQKLEHSSRKE